MDRDQDIMLIDCHRYILPLASLRSINPRRRIPSTTPTNLHVLMTTGDDNTRDEDFVKSNCGQHYRIGIDGGWRFSQSVDRLIAQV